jgi:hypothetical protein
MNLMERVKAILLSPKTEWVVIDSESGDATFLFTNYVAILAAIPAAASFVGQTVLGWPIGRNLLSGIFLYVLFCALWYIQGYVIDAMATTFGGRKSLPSALKVSAYSSTAAWAAGIFQLIPALGILGIIGALYSLYLLWTGLPVLMKNPREKALLYTAAVVAVMIVIMVIVTFILGFVLWPM